MRFIRLVGLVSVAVVAMSFAVVSSASAFSANPLFIPSNGQSVRSVGLGNAVLVAAGNTITCTAHQTVSGTVANSLLIGNVVIHYLGCSLTETLPGKEVGCSVKSVGAPAENLILTTTLHGILGLLLPSNKTGILFLPVADKVIFDMAKAEKGGKECIGESPVEGSIAALIAPIGVGAQTTGKLVTLAVAKPAIDLTHGLGTVTAKLTTFGETATQEQTDDVTFGEATEVT
jgi:hypothetical protein